MQCAVKVKGANLSLGNTSITHPNPPSYTCKRHLNNFSFQDLWFCFLYISLTRPLAILCTISNHRWPVLSPRCTYEHHKWRRNIFDYVFRATHQDLGPGSWVGRTVERKLSSCNFFLIITRYNDQWSISILPTKLNHLVRNDDDDWIIMIATMPIYVRHWAKCFFLIFNFYLNNTATSFPPNHFILKKFYKWQQRWKTSTMNIYISFT